MLSVMPARFVRCIERAEFVDRAWLLYDSAFRQQIMSYETTDISKINQSLYAMTFLAYCDRGQVCATCMQSGHSQKEYALKPACEGPRNQMEERRREEQRGGK